MTEWQDISTAPKDGSEFVMLDARVQTACVGHWMDNVSWRNEGLRPGEARAEPAWFPLATPTHWMPLPPPPATDSDGDQ